jgi:hypothetical protein
MIYCTMSRTYYKLPEVNDNILYLQPFILEDVSVKLGQWSGYNL